MKNTTQTTTPAAAPFTRLSRCLFRLLGSRSDESAKPIKVNIDLCLAQAARRARRYADTALPEALQQAFSVEPLAAGDARLVQALGERGISGSNQPVRDQPLGNA
jgi:hypothetical protein